MMNEGWVCPKCGRVLAPNIMYCLWCCSGRGSTTTSTADRKTEQTEKPNNCETCKHHTDGTVELCRTCSESNYEPNDEPQTDDIGVPWTDCQTALDEPQAVGYCNECKWCGDKQVCGRCRSRNLYTPKTEPQIERSEK